MKSFASGKMMLDFHSVSISNNFLTMRTRRVIHLSGLLYLSHFTALGCALCVSVLCLQFSCQNAAISRRSALKTGFDTKGCVTKLKIFALNKTSRKNLTCTAKIKYQISNFPRFFPFGIFVYFLAILSGKTRETAVLSHMLSSFLSFTVFGDLGEVRQPLISRP